MVSAGTFHAGGSLGQQYAATTRHGCVFVMGETAPARFCDRATGMLDAIPPGRDYPSGVHTCLVPALSRYPGPIQQIRRTTAMAAESIPFLRIGGIQIKLHITWLLIMMLVTWSLADSYFPDSVSGYSTGAYWLAGGIVAILFFVSLLAHELAHSLMARARGLKVVGITLYLFGGVSEIDEEATNAGDELRITVVGPLTSFALSAIFGGLWALMGGTSDLVTSALGYLAIINLFLGLFNLLPGLPLDGGRILHALVWLRTGDRTRATRVAVGSGVVVGYLLVTAGIIYVFTGYWVNGLWLIFLGWYLQSLAGREMQATQARSLFAGLRVADLTDPNPHAVDLDMSLERVVDDVMMRYQARAVPVVANGDFRGLLTLQRIAQTPKTDWPITQASSVMIPAEEVATASPEQSLESAIAMMQKRDVNQLVVLQNGAMVGLLNRSTVLRQLEIRQALSEDEQVPKKPRGLLGRVGER